MTTNLLPWEVHTFKWGTAVKHRKGEWEQLFLSPDGREVDVRGIVVELTDEGIFFK